MRVEQAIFNLEIKKNSGLSINPDIRHSKVFSLGQTCVQRVIKLRYRKKNRIYNKDTVNTVYSMIFDSYYHLNILCN